MNVSAKDDCNEGQKVTRILWYLPGVSLVYPESMEDLPYEERGGLNGDEVRGRDDRRLRWLHGGHTDRYSLGSQKVCRLRDEGERKGRD